MAQAAQATLPKPEKEALSEEARLIAAYENSPTSESHLRALHDYYTAKLMRHKVLPFYQRFIEATPYRTLHHFNIAAIFEQSNRLAEARAILERMQKEAPSEAHTRYLAFKLLVREQRYEEALSYYETTLSSTFMVPDIKHKALFDAANLYDKLGMTDQAMQTVEQANQLLLEQADAPCDGEVFLLMCRAFINSIQPAMIARLTQLEDTDASPPVVFLTGFPRSGTTLMHEMLAAVEGVSVTEEVGSLNRTMAQAQREFGDFATLFASATPEDIARLRQHYWQDLQQHLPNAHAGVVIDKHPLHSAKMPFIKLLFPHAPIVFMERHPFDCCLSGFMQSFQPNHAMVNFATLRGALNLYGGVMQVWLRSREYLKLRHYNLRYESLVQDPESEIRKLLAFLQLPWSDQIMNYHERVAQRYIYTPSYQQVNQPVNAASVGRWKRYASYFEPYKTVMKPYLDAFGYDADVV